MKIAKTAEVETNGMEVKHYPVAALARSKEIPYREIDSGWVDELSTNIEANGLDNPVHVWDKKINVKRGDGSTVEGRYIVAGLHRTEAIRRIEKRNPKRYTALFPQGVPVIEHTGEVAEMMLVLLRENVNRKDMQADQILPIVRELRDKHGMKATQIAKAVNKSDSWLSQIFDIEETLGEEGTEEIVKGKMGIRSAKRVAEKVKAKKAKGEAVSVKDEIAAEQSAKGGKQRAKKRLSAKVLYERYNNLPASLTLGKRVDILLGAIAYLAQDTEKVPAELKKDAA